MRSSAGLPRQRPCNREFSLEAAGQIRDKHSPSPLASHLVSDSEELRVIVYQGDSGFIALCPVYPGVTGEGPTREACVEDLQRKIELLRSTPSQAEG